MSRTVRLESAGAYDHIMARGNHREAIFHDDDDQRIFLNALSQACEMTSWHVHAWVQPFAAEMVSGHASLWRADEEAGGGPDQDGGSSAAITGASAGQRTVVSQKWPAEKLQRKSAANVSQQLRWFTRHSATKKAPPALRVSLQELDNQEENT